MSGHNGGTAGARMPLGAVDPNDERFVPSSAGVKAKSGVHKSSATTTVSATPHKHSHKVIGGGGGGFPVSSTAKKSAKHRSVLGKVTSGRLRVLVDQPTTKAKSASSSSEEVGEWRHKYERMLLEKTRLEADLQAKQALVDELTAQVSAITEQQHVHPSSSSSSSPSPLLLAATVVDNASDNVNVDSERESPSKKRRRVNVVDVEQQRDDDDVMEPPTSNNSSVHEMSDTVGDQTVDGLSSDVGGHQTVTATIADSLASDTQLTEKKPSRDIEPRTGEQTATTSKDDLVSNNAEEEDVCMGVRIQHEPQPSLVSEQLREKSLPTTAANTPNTSRVVARQSSQGESEVFCDSPREPTSTLADAHNPAAQASQQATPLGTLTTSQVLRFEALSRLPIHHDLPIDASPQQVIVHLRREIQTLKANRGEEMNALKTFHRHLEESDHDNRLLSAKAAALETQVKELTPMHAFVVESEILRECEQLEAARSREELVASREESRRAHRSIKVLGEAFKAKLKSCREVIQRLRASEKAHRERANETDFTGEVTAQQLADEKARVRDIYDERIAALEVHIVDLQNEQNRDRTTHETRQRELMFDNEKQRRELNRLRAAQVQRGGDKRARPATFDTPPTSDTNPPKRRRRTLSSASSSSSPSTTTAPQRQRHSKTPPPPSTLKRAPSLAEIPTADVNPPARTCRVVKHTRTPPPSSSSSSSSSRKRTRAESDQETHAAPLPLPLLSSEIPSTGQGGATTSPQQQRRGRGVPTENDNEAKRTPSSTNDNPPAAPLPLDDEPPLSFTESLRQVQLASNSMFDSVRELKSHLADIHELLAQGPSKGESTGDSSSVVGLLKDKLSTLDVDAQEQRAC